MNDFKAVEKLFSYDEHHFVSQNLRIFTNATLKRDFGRFKAGTIIPEIHIDGIWLCIMENPKDFRHHDGPEYNFRLSFEYISE
jgi:hypothetical protein